MSPGKVRNARHHRLAKLRLRRTNVSNQIAKGIRRNFVASAITASVIWFFLVSFAWVLISFVWNPPQMHSPQVRIAYLQIALGLVGGGAAVFAIYAGLLALREQLGFPELCLHVSYLGPNDTAESHIVFDGDPPLKGPGRPKPITEVRLALMNCSNFPATEVTVLLSANSGATAEHSEYFTGPEGSLFNNIIRTNWRVKDGTIIPPKPRYAPIDKEKERFKRFPSEVLASTWLELGNVRWDRAEGIYWLQINAFAKSMPTSASFQLSLPAEPTPAI